jgi:hypothetical protein
VEVAGGAPATLTDREPDFDTGSPGDVLTVFTVLWAAAALFHVLGPSGRASQLVDDVTLLGTLHVVLGAIAVATIVLPRRTALLVALAVVSPVTAWLEAPTLGNHWLVASLVDLGIVGAALAARRGWRIDRDRLAEVAIPIACWTLAAFYLFAAFAKLNHAFFDTSAGCGTFYFDELAGSLGFSTPIAVGRDGLAHLVPIGVAGTELAIPLLLLNRRTRNAGVALGLVFHSIIALDQTHLFSDFSSVLNALFCLLLPAAWATGVVRWFARQSSAAQQAVRGAIAAGFTVALVALATKGVPSRGFRDLRMLLWLVTDGAVLVAVFAYLRREWRLAADRPFALGAVPRWLWALLFVVVFNGLTPYLEIKTAYSYNMYSNLQTADGNTNHFLVPRTFPVNGNAADVVRILDSSDPGLAVYTALHYDLPYLSLRAYLSDHRDASVRYLRNGVEHDLAHASDEPDLVRPVNPVERRLFALRAVDQEDPPRCQDVFLPAL